MSIAAIAWCKERRAMMNHRRVQRISNHLCHSPPSHSIDAAATAGWPAVYNSEESQPAVSPRSLRGLTVFVTGASRGIGLALALRAAADGANIVIAAKSETEDPRIPGTIYSAAKEVEAAGGRALPIAVDIRSEIAVEAAVARAVAHFGGIDILINNASAISLTPTPDTSMKRYDLMHSVNARGTFMVTQKCLPHLQKSRHAHVLNISPPLNMETKWFAPHVAYTMAKYGACAHRPIALLLQVPGCNAFFRHVHVRVGNGRRARRLLHCRQRAVAPHRNRHGCGKELAGGR